MCQYRKHDGSFEGSHCVAIWWVWWDDGRLTFVNFGRVISIGGIGKHSLIHTTTPCPSIDGCRLSRVVTLSTIVILVFCHLQVSVFTGSSVELLIDLEALSA